MIPNQRYKGTEIKILWTKTAAELGISDSSSTKKDKICSKIEELVVHYQDPLISDIQVPANTNDILTRIPVCFSPMIIGQNDSNGTGTHIMSFHNDTSLVNLNMFLKKSIFHCRPDRRILV